MRSSSRIALVAAAVLMAMLGFGIARWWAPGGPQVEALATGSLLVPPRDLPAFSLLDQNDHAFTAASLRGHWSLLFFGYTNCPDLCPTTLATLATLQREWRQDKADHPRVVFVSVDARRDTPAVLARYVPSFDPSFTGVTASGQPQIEEFARRLGAVVIVGPEHDGTYGVDHSGSLFVISPRGQLAAILSPPLTLEGLRSDIARVMAGGT